MRLTTFVAAAVGTAAVVSSADATTIYAADFSVDGGFQHNSSSGNQPATGPQSLSLSGWNFTLSYAVTPFTDSTLNYFRVNDGKLEMQDFGGDHAFQSVVIDVSAWNEVEISLDGDTFGSEVFNASTEFFAASYSLDGGTRAEYFRTQSDGSLDASATVNVTGVDNLVVWFESNQDGANDGYAISSYTVTGTIAIPEPATLGASALLGLTAVRRRRR